MTLAELKQKCETQGFRYAYGRFKEPTEPSHLIAICRDTDNFMADNKVYEKDTNNEKNNLFDSRGHYGGFFYGCLSRW